MGDVVQLLEHMCELAKQGVRLPDMTQRRRDELDHADMEFMVAASLVLLQLKHIDQTLFSDILRRDIEAALAALAKRDAAREEWAQGEAP